MSDSFTIQTTVHFGRGGRGGRKQLHPGAEPRTPVLGRVPRVARLMARNEVRRPMRSRRHLAAT